MKNLKLQENPQNTLRSQLNTSSSKMQYTISRSNRFSYKNLEASNDQFYEIPDTKTKRTTSFGYGNKIDISKKNMQTPAPSQYYVPSDFTNEKKKGITMSAGRQIVKSHSVFQTRKDGPPGPGQYEPKNPLLDDRNEKRGYSLSGRNKDFSDKWIKSVPGPGNYETLQLLDKNMKSSNSRIENIKNGRFPKSKRRSDFEELSTLRNPAPGQYDRASDVDSTAKYVKQGGYHFSHSPRKGIIDNKKLVTPGPGSQQLFSQNSKSFSQFLH